MDIKSIQEILKLVNKSNLTEVEIEKKDFKIKVKKNSGSENVIYSNIPVQQAVAAPVVPPSTDSAAPQAKEATSKDSGSDNKSGAEDSKLIEFKSPMIGTFYRSSGPDKEPFIKVGDVISNGQVVCIVEAMKLFNEIESDVEGKIVKILVENAQPVEYDQPLFLIEPA